MPTGYTHKVQTGEVTQFNEFLWNCARSFGALIHMREDSVTEEIRYAEPSEYNKEAYERTCAEYDRILSLTAEEAEQESQKDYDKNIKYHNETIAANRLSRKRYETMIEKVNLWEPPTEDHSGLKEFMLEQLQSSIKWDCDIDYYLSNPPKKIKGIIYKCNLLGHLMENRQRHAQEWGKEKKRVEEKNEWISRLNESVPFQQK